MNNVLVDGVTIAAYSAVVKVTISLITGVDAYVSALLDTNCALPVKLRFEDVRA